MGSDDTVSIDPSDEELFGQLGLAKFANVTSEENLGRVELDDGSWVDVTVHAPFPFWTFLIWTADGRRTTKLECGSGTLSEYWPFAEAVAEGMVKCSPVETPSEG